MNVISIIKKLIPLSCIEANSIHIPLSRSNFETLYSLYRVNGIDTKSKSCGMENYGENKS